MQAVNATDTGGRGELAANGMRRSSSSSLKADFAAMLSDIGDATLGDGTLSGIFGAMRELKDKHASLASDISCKRRDLKTGNDHTGKDQDDTVGKLKSDSKIDQDEPRERNEAAARTPTSEDDELPAQDQASTVNVQPIELTSDAAEGLGRMEDEVENWLGALMQPESQTPAAEDGVAPSNASTENAAALSADTAAETAFGSEDPARIVRTQSQDPTQPGRTQNGSVTVSNVQADAAQVLVQNQPKLPADGGQSVRSDPVSQMISEEVADSGLAVMMAKAGVTKVSLSASGGDDVVSLSEGISADLEVIDDALQAAAALADEGAEADSNSKWFSQSESSYRSQSDGVKPGQLSAPQSQDQSVTQALAALRVSGGMITDEAVQQAANSKNVAAALGTASMGAETSEESGVSKSTALDGTSSSILPDTGSISKSREMGRSAQAQDLRSQMLTLSRDARRNAEEITKAVMTMAARNLKTLSFELNPQGLGRMEISIDSDAAEDAVKVNLAAENGATRQLLSQGLNELKDSLNRAGLAADAEMGEFSGDDAHGQREERSDSRGFGEEKSRTLFAGTPENDEVESAAVQEGLDDTLSLYA